MIFPEVLSISFLLWTTLGVILGVVVGCIPGLTGAMVIALTLPLTFTMPAADALALLIAIYVGSVSGGLISATLLNIPGTPASMMTTMDGYPMSAGGRPRRALSLGIGASLVGGLFSGVVLIMVAQKMAQWSTEIGFADMFSLVLLALVLIAVISRDSLLAGLFSGCLGLLAALPGVHPASGQIRLTFGWSELNNGFSLLPVLMGLFAVSQLLRDAATAKQGSGVSTPAEQASAGMASTPDGLPLSDWKSQMINMLRSSTIGTFVGILPGVGANIGSVMSYAAARSQSRQREQFGKGCDEGIVASEAANNATVGGALIPLIALGIPGSVIDAILLGAFVIHGLQPGPLLFENNPEIAQTIMLGYVVANVVMFAFMMLTARWLVRLTAIPKGFLVPVLLTFCVLGAYALSNRMFDVWTMVAFGLVGLLFDRLRIPTAPFVIGFVLSPIAEVNLCAALMASGNDWSVFLTEQPSLSLLVLAALIVLMSVFRRKAPPGDA
ncbi:MAG: tripartite tricarboxylate transporter permease [Planctomycetaceae bacterium]|nr:tripartite tricarboxylate transporter permease [Planctomycetaceae bacterium]